MNIGLIHCSTPERESETNSSIVLWSAKDVAGKWLGRRLICVIASCRLISQNRKIGPKISPCITWSVDRVENRWLEVAFGLVVVSSHNYLFLIDHSSQSPYLACIYDPGIVGILFWVFAIEFNHGFTALRNKLIGHLLVNICVPGRSAPLPAPCSRSPHNFLRRIRHVRGLIHDGWVLSPNSSSTGVIFQLPTQRSLRSCRTRK